MTAPGGTALITGASGQDGSYLVEELLGQGYRVYGAVRNVEDAASALRQHGVATGDLQLVACAMDSKEDLSALLADLNISEVYNLAAMARGTAMFNDAVALGDINAQAVIRLLEAIRRVDPRIRLCQASSSEMFGLPAEQPQDESTAFHPRSPYGSAKLYAHSLIGMYRQRYDLFACSAILFNHESPRRGLDFVTRKITRAAAEVKLGRRQTVTLGNLDARRDWGYAADYVRAMRMMLAHPVAEDFVIATGKTHAVRELCQYAFDYLGLDYRAHVLENDPHLTRDEAGIQLVGDPSKAQTILGWRPSIGFFEMIRMMVDSDLRQLSEAT